MGYIASSPTEYLDLHLTERGRRLLLQGSLGDQIVKFALGDGDEDYQNNQQLTSGFVPDVTGAHLNCIFGVNDGYEIKDKIQWVEGGQSLLRQQQQAEMVFGYQSEGSYLWANKALVNVYLHDYLAMLKVLALHNAPYHSFGTFNSSNFTTYFSQIFDSGGVAWSQDIKEFFETLEEQGKDLNLNFIDKIFKRVTGTISPTNVKLTLVGNNNQTLFKKFVGSVYIQSDSTPMTQDGPQYGLGNPDKILSPFCMSNSIYTDVNNTSWAGAGPMGINIGGAIDYGYSFVSVIQPNVAYYPDYGFENTIGGYYNIFQTQNSSFNQQFDTTNLDCIIPSARFILPQNPDTNAYFILQTNQINMSNTNTHFTSASGGLQGQAATESTSAWETFGMFMAGTAQYEVKPGVGYGKQFKKQNHPNTNLEPKMGVTTLIYQTIQFFEALELDPLCSTFITVSGTGVNKVYTVPFTIQASDNANIGTATATLNLNFILSLPALYSNFTLDSPIAFRTYDTSQLEARFYGGGYDGLTEYTTDPTHWHTTGVNEYKTFVDFKPL